MSQVYAELLQDFPEFPNTYEMYENWHHPIVKYVKYYDGGWSVIIQCTNNKLAKIQPDEYVPMVLD